MRSPTKAKETRGLLMGDSIPMVEEVSSLSTILLDGSFYKFLTYRKESLLTGLFLSCNVIVTV
jgi:hypothetical protein